jgi:hypothetical protein
MPNYNRGRIDSLQASSLVATRMHDMTGRIDSLQASSLVATRMHDMTELADQVQGVAQGWQKGRINK